MNDAKDHMLRAIESGARREAECLAGELAYAASVEKEAILAALEFERWLATSCRDARF
jgi:hypothetical protein